MEEAEKIARNRGFRKMNLTVAEANLQAITFYERLGWRKRLENDVWEGQFTKILDE